MSPQSALPFFAKLTIVTNIQTDHTTPSVAIGHIYAMNVMRPNKKVTNTKAYVSCFAVSHVI